MNSGIRILSTKKLQPNQKQFLLNAGLAVVEVDFITIKYKPVEVNGLKQNLIFTSQNAVKSIIQSISPEQLKEHGCFCVGEKTKALLEKQGFKVIASAENALLLGKELAANFGDRSFTFFTGNLRRDELPAELNKSAIEFNEIEIYKTRLSPIKMTIPLEAILFFSPSAVESYLKENNITNEICFCIGKTTSKALENLTSKTIIANQPTVESVISKCIDYYKKT